MLRLIVFGLAIGLLFSVHALAGDLADDEGLIEYRLLATSKTSTMQTELDEAAARGFRFSTMMGGATLGGPEIVVTLERPLSGNDIQHFEYKLLATSKTATMKRELRIAGEQGYAHVGQSVAETAFGGDEIVVVLERPLGLPSNRYVYQLLATKRTSTMNKELKKSGRAGFRLQGLTVSKTAFSGEELVSILMKTATQTDPL